MGEATRFPRQIRVITKEGGVVDRSEAKGDGRMVRGFGMFG
jgi:hypothetical protein